MADASAELRALLAAIDNALTMGSYMTGANLAFEMLCDRLAVDRDTLAFDRHWASTMPARPGWDLIVKSVDRGRR